MAKLKEIILQVFFSPAVFGFMKRYSDKYLVRLLVMLSYGFLLSLVSGAPWWFCLMVSFLVELAMVDCYTKKLMKPAFSMVSQLGDHGDDANITFFVVNGLTYLLFLNSWPFWIF